MIEVFIIALRLFACLEIESDERFNTKGEKKWLRPLLLLIRLTWTIENVKGLKIGFKKKKLSYNLTDPVDGVLRKF
jgi:hypothetical protein